MQHDKIDLTSSAEEIAEQLRSQKVEGEYLFFAAYLAKPDEGEAAKVNGELLRLRGGVFYGIFVVVFLLLRVCTQARLI